MENLSDTILQKYYGPVKAVDGVSFTVSKGEIFGLLGPNGGSKTTIVEAVTGLIRGDRGNLFVLGVDPAIDPVRVKSQIGAQLQMAHFSSFDSAGNYPSFWSIVSRRRSEKEVLSLTGLADKARVLVEKLSRGQLKRFSVGLALVGEVEVIFLDEPISGLDPQSWRNLWEVILTLRKEGKTVFLTTHYLDEAEKLCNRVAIID